MGNQKEGSTKTLLVNRGMAWHNAQWNADTADLTQILADTANEATKTNTTSGYQRHQRYQRSTSQHIFSAPGKKVHKTFDI